MQSGSVQRRGGGKGVSRAAHADCSALALFVYSALLKLVFFAQSIVNKEVQACKQRRRHMFPNLSNLRLEKVACKTALRGWQGGVPSPWLANSRQNEYHSRGGGGDGLSAADKKLLEDAKDAKAQLDKLMADAKGARAQRNSNSRSIKTLRKDLKTNDEDLKGNIAKVEALQEDADQIRRRFQAVLARLDLMTKRDELLEKRMNASEITLKAVLDMVDNTNVQLIALRQSIRENKKVDEKMIEELTEEVGAQKAYVSRLAELVETYVAALINDEDVYNPYVEDPSRPDPIPQEIVETEVVAPQRKTSDDESSEGIDADSDPESEDVEDAVVDRERPPINLTGYLAPASSTFSNLDDAASLNRSQ